MHVYVLVEVCDDMTESRNIDEEFTEILGPVPCPWCEQPMVLLPVDHFFYEDEDYIWGCETLGCKAGLWRMYPISEQEEVEKTKRLLQ